MPPYFAGSRGAWSTKPCGRSGNSASSEPEAALLDRLAERLEHVGGNLDLLHALDDDFKDAGLQDDLRILRVDALGQAAGLFKVRLVVLGHVPDAGRAAEEFDAQLADGAQVVVERVAVHQPRRRHRAGKIALQHLAAHVSVKIKSHRFSSVSGAYAPRRILPSAQPRPKPPGKRAPKPAGAFPARAAARSSRNPRPTGLGQTAPFSALSAPLRSAPRPSPCRSRARRRTRSGPFPAARRGRPCPRAPTAFPAR